MSKFTKKSVIMTLMSFAILATVFSVQLKTALDVPNVNAQQFPGASLSNSTDFSPQTNMSTANLTESLESFGPMSQMEAVIREVENANAIGYATGQQIETITNNMTDNMSNNSDMTGSQNMTGESTNDTAMRAVIEQTEKANALGFAANNVINMTTPQSAGP